MNVACQNYPYVLSSIFGGYTVTNKDTGQEAVLTREMFTSIFKSESAVDYMHEKTFAKKCEMALS